MNDDGSQRRSSALALLAVLVGAIVQITSNSGPFTLWQSIVGLIMICTAFAYDRDIGDTLFERLSFSLILAGGFVFLLGFWIDRALVKRGLIEWNCVDLPCKIKASKPGFVSDNIEDDAYFKLWLGLGAIFVVYYAIRGRNR